MNPDEIMSLKEVASLAQTIEKLKLECLEESKRLDLLKRQEDANKMSLQGAEENLSTFSRELTTKENELSSLDSKLEMLLSKEANLFTEVEIQSFTKQKEHFESEKQMLEESIFDLMEKTELLQSEIKDKKQFDTGIVKTITEIQAEVDSFTKERETKILGLKERIDLLLDSIPVMIKQKLEKLLTKNLPYGPLAFFKGDACSICSFKTTRLDVDKVEVKKQPINCQGCSRLIIPS